MTDLLVKIIPLDLASTLSPGILALAVYLLSNKDYRIARTVSFWAGSLLVAIILAVIGLKLGSTIQDPNNKRIIDNIVDLILSAIFFYFGIKSLLVKDKNRKENNVDKHHSRDLWKWFLIGLVISITNFDAVIFNLTAAKEIGQSVVGDTSKFLLLIMGMVFFTLPIILPLVLYLIMPKLAQKVLDPLNTFLTKYGQYIVAIIFIAFAVYLLIKGLQF
jgi:threonine/homoserine/homoserine lactone efflux protein